MQIWLDTLEEGIIQIASEMGVLSGITTNYEMMHRSPRPILEQVQRLLDIQEGPVAVQILAEEKNAIVEQAHDLSRFSPRIIVKVPATSQGFAAIRILSEHQIPTMVTAVFHPKQVLFASLVGADFAAPFFHRIEENGDNAQEALLEMHNLLKTYKSSTKLLVASLRTIAQLTFCYQNGFDACTICGDLFKEMIETPPLTLSFIEDVKKLWPDLRIP